MRPELQLTSKASLVWQLAFSRARHLHWVAQPNQAATMALRGTLTPADAAPAFLARVVPSLPRLQPRPPQAPAPSGEPPRPQQLASREPMDAPYSLALAAADELEGSQGTWISHWQRMEQEERLREEIARGTRGRWRRRQLAVRTVALAQLLGPAAAEEADLSLQRLAGGDGGKQPQQQLSAADVEELTWLASLPGPEPQAGADDAEAANASSSGALRVRVSGQPAAVRPMWVSVLQEQDGGPAELFDTAVPLQAGVVEQLSARLAPFVSITGGLHFAEGADIRHGTWRSYFVGLVGGVAATEHEVLWPNQVLHRDRVLFNARGASDLARFLADPSPEDMHSHRENLLRLAEERGYRKGWCWRMLCLRWGEAALQRHGVRV